MTLDSVCQTSKRRRQGGETWRLPPNSAGETQVPLSVLWLCCIMMIFYHRQIWLVEGGEVLMKKNMDVLRYLQRVPFLGDFSKADYGNGRAIKHSKAGSRRCNSGKQPSDQRIFKYYRKNNRVTAFPPICCLPAITPALYPTVVAPAVRCRVAWLSSWVCQG